MPNKKASRNNGSNKKSSKQTTSFDDSISNSLQSRFWLRRFFVCLIICGIIWCGMFAETEIEYILNSGNVVSASTTNTNGVVFDDGKMKIYFVDVGCGDSSVIELPDDKIMVIDAGNDDDRIMDYLAEEIFDDRSDDIIDYFVLTHAHTDHYGRAVEIMEEYQVQNIYRPTRLGNDEYSLYSSMYPTYEKFEIGGTEYNAVINAFYDEVDDGAQMYFNADGIVLGNGVLTSTEGYRMTFLGPYDDVYDRDDENNYCPFIMVEYLDSRILMCADATTYNEGKLLNSSVDVDWLDVDILKLGHHGSKTSSSLDFLNATSPEYVVISTEEGVHSDLPSATVLARLTIDCGLSDDAILRTDEVGNIALGYDVTSGLLSIVTAENAVTVLPVFIELEYVLTIITIAIFFVAFKYDAKKKLKITRKVSRGAGVFG